MWSDQLGKQNAAILQLRSKQDGYTESEQKENRSENRKFRAATNSETAWKCQFSDLEKTVPEPMDDNRIPLPAPQRVPKARVHRVPKYCISNNTLHQITQLYYWIQFNWEFGDKINNFGVFVHTS